MDPYLTGSFRLADRRGLLTGDLSRVQDYALQALLVMEGHDRGEEFVRDLKVNLLAANPSSEQARLLFPEWYGDSVPEADADDFEATGGPVEYEFSNPVPEDAEEILARLMANASVTTMASDIPDDGWQ